jgi:hypothetical protein
MSNGRRATSSRTRASTRAEAWVSTVEEVLGGEPFDETRYARCGCSVCRRKGRLHVYDLAGETGGRGRQMVCPLCRGSGWRLVKIGGDETSGGTGNA